MTEIAASKEAREYLHRAGQIAAEALTYTCSLVKAKTALISIAEAGEERIRELGGQPAFPINLSINHFAAHYTPGIGDTSVVPDQALVKVDLGAHVKGYIADNARTVIIGGNSKEKQLCEAAKAGLEAALKTVKAGIRVWTVSKAISKAIHQKGVNPIENLTGHSIERFNLHSGISIPSVTSPTERLLSPRLRENMVIAIEPFSTFSKVPRISNLESSQIFGFAPNRNPSNKELRRIFSQMKVKFAQLPFASRWMKDFVSPDKIMTILEELMKEGCIHNYAVLGLRDNQFVAQSEATMIVEKNGCTVITPQ
jgi:methionyl aminopeptidase